MVRVYAGGDYDSVYVVRSKDSGKLENELNTRNHEVKLISLLL